MEMILKLGSKTINVMILGVFTSTKKWSLEVGNSCKLAIFVQFLLYAISKLHFLVDVNAPIECYFNTIK